MPSDRAKVSVSKRVPRMRGDDPSLSGSSAPRESFYEFPACAGMIRTSERRARDVTGVPRMRGDDPVQMVSVDSTIWSSPHARG